MPARSRAAVSPGARAVTSSRARSNTKKRPGAWDLSEYRAYPLVDGMVLHAARGVRVREALRFAAVFIEVWQALPAVRRDQIRRFWQLSDERRRRALRRAAESGTTRRPLPPPIVPFLTLDTMCLQYLVFGGRRRGTTQAITTNRGNTIRFLAPFVSRLPRRHACALVAHELAHMLQAVGRHDPQAILRDSTECEAQADDIAWGWGFSVAALEAWELRHVQRWERGLPAFRRRRRRAVRARSPSRLGEGPPAKNEEH